MESNSVNSMKICIAFPDTWLKFSPTVINFSKFLVKKGHIVTILATNSKNNFVNIDNVTIVYFNTEENTTIKKLLIFQKLWIKFVNLLFKFTGSIKIYELLYTYIVKNSFITFYFYKYLKKNNFDIIISVDNIAVVASTLARKKTHFLSLEIAKSIYYYLINWKYIDTLIIQTKERRDYILSKKRLTNLPIFFVQNAPIYKPLIDSKIDKDKFSLVYFGMASIEYNFIKELVNSLYFLDKKYRLILKIELTPPLDIFFKTECSLLIQDKRLIIDTNYIEDSNVQNYLSQYGIGISFYNTDSVHNQFNVVSCPSGKLFNYYNSALPVITNNILGHGSVTEFNTGILIGLVSPEEIAKAVSSIQKEYNLFSKNAVNAAIYFDFKENINIYIDEL